MCPKVRTIVEPLIGWTTTTTKTTKTTITVVHKKEAERGNS